MLADIVNNMRARRLDVLFLTDMGGLQLESRVVHYVGVEEFVFVIFRMVAYWC